MASPINAPVSAFTATPIKIRVAMFVRPELMLNERTKNVAITPPAKATNEIKEL